MEWLKVLDGAKTYIIGIGSIGGGAFLLTQGQGEVGMLLISVGLGQLGLSHKGNRIIKALQVQGAVPKKSGTVSRKR